MSKIDIGSLPEGLDAQFLIDKFKKTSNDFVFIARDDKRLEAIKTALLFFDPKLNYSVIPAWDCGPYELISPNPKLISQRIRSLSKIDKNSKKYTIYLTTLNAASQYFPPRIIIEKSFLYIQLGKLIDEEFLKKLLVEFGYVRTSIVSEPGDFSVRGGIIDIFTSGVDGAVRIDLFGDVVDKLRKFDPETQLTIEHFINFQLLPISEVIINDATVTNFRINFRKEFGATGRQNALYAGISNRIRSQGIEHWLPLFYDNLESLFSYLPKASYFLDQEIKNNLIQRWEMINEQFDARNNLSIKSGIETVLSSCSPELLYLSPEVFELCLEQKNVYQLSTFDLPADENTINANGGIGQKFFLTRQSQTIQLLDAVSSFIKKSRSVTFTIIAAVSEGSRDRLIDLLRDEGVNNLVKINSFKEVSKNKTNVFMAIWPIEEGFYSNHLTVISESDIFGQKLNTSPRRISRSKNVITDTLSLEIGDVVIHVDHGIGQFQGFETIQTSGSLHECLLIEYAEQSRLFLPVENIELLSKYGQKNIALDKLGSTSWQKRKSKLKKQILEMAEDLIKTAAVRKIKKVKPLDTSFAEWEQFCSRFNYFETDDQIEAINAIIEDFGSGVPMDRLICGDVGYGKTEIAMRAAFIVAMSGFQVAIVCPTTLLSRQHFNSLLERFRDLPINIKQLSRLTPKSEINNLKDDLYNGKIDILVGTHSLLSNTVHFSRLGLLVIDEEQHFGVAHKEKLKDLRSDIHVLTLTATPIPRTLHMSLSGLRDLSIIATPPVDRLSIRTYISEFDSLTIRQALLREHFRGGQSFVVVPRINDIASLEGFLIKNVPELSYTVAHAKIPASELDQRMNDFYDRRYDVLLATTIIESGLDVSSANTIIIHNADMFGLSQLYQLRGRVGRSKLRAYAYLTTKFSKKITVNAQKRLKIISSLTDLGGGFSLASQDLDLRGAGNLLGDAQSGHIREIGYELYHSLLEEAVSKLKDGITDSNVEYDKEWTPQLNLGLPVIIPDDYISEVSVRLDLYKKLSGLSTKVELEGFASQLIDRFGPLPKEINSLLSVIQIKAICKKIGVNQIDAGTTGFIVDLRKDHKLNTEKLINYINTINENVNIKNNKLAYQRKWKSNKDKVKIIFTILRNLRSLCENI